MPCDGVRITVLDENFIDILLPSTSRVTRYGMDQHFNSKYGEILAENGLCFYVETFSAGTVTTVLFDAGLTAPVVLHNAALLGIDLADVDAVVLSHGHPDHTGGVIGVLEAIGHPVPVIVHPDAFDPRMIVKPYVTLPMINIGLNRERVERAGGGLIQARGPIQLGPGLFTSGEMETAFDFELEAPTGRWCVHADGAVEPDDINDHQVLGIDIAGVGVLVIDPCGHRGIVSSTEHMRKLLSNETIYGVMGGFHTGHPGISAHRIENTARRLAEYSPQLIAPMHCSGFPLKRAVAEVAPDAFELITAGSVITVGEVPPQTRKLQTSSVRIN
ncbi:MBL fold metallo-hydrolase [Dactylosporangium sp. NPDC051484]|uniref:MBL fold metallo-hydrolase n=1 Tax=Dactylosporangium sp. NPDC051484 TaxID=3154942 RepID=UPI00344E2F85